MMQALWHLALHCVHLESIQIAFTNSDYGVRKMALDHVFDCTLYIITVVWMVNCPTTVSPPLSLQMIHGSKRVAGTVS